MPGTRFNFAFWDVCMPRRSTYNACRAVLAATRQSPTLEDPMIQAIQQAYYLHARNPSDINTLVDLAADIGLDRAHFAAELTGAAVQRCLGKEISLANSVPVNGFPSLVVHLPLGMYPVELDYLNAAPMRQQIAAMLKLP